MRVQVEEAMTTPKSADKLVENLREEAKARALDLEASEEEMLEWQAATLIESQSASLSLAREALRDHGIEVKADGSYEYEDNSALGGEQPCKWARTMRDADRYGFCMDHGFPHSCLDPRDGRKYWYVTVGDTEHQGETPTAAIDAALSKLATGGKE